MGDILPLALTMMIGPQIITAILLVTAKDVIKPSLAFISAVAVATTAGTAVIFAVASLFNLSAMRTDEPSKLAKVIQTGIIVLLILATFKTFINREKVTLPAWMSKLQTATPKDAFKYGLLLIFLMPTDIAMMLTVGINLASRSHPVRHFLPFLVLTVLIAALPLLGYLLFHKKAVTAMPRVRAWMEDNSWVVSVAAYLIFIYLLW